MMTEAVIGKSKREVALLSADLHRTFTGAEDGWMSDAPSALAPLSALMRYPARRRCVLLAWEALAEAIRAP